MTTTVHDEDTTMTQTPEAYPAGGGPARDETRPPAARPALTWGDDPAIVHLDETLRKATTAIVKNGLGGFMEVAEAEIPGPVPDGESIQGATVRVVLRTPEDAEWVRGQLAADFPQTTVEPSAGPSDDTALYLWVAGPHGRVGTYTNQKCRCILCTVAWRQKNNQMRDERRAKARANPDLLVHGRASTRTNYGCDCELCKAAHAAAALYRKQRGRLKKVVDMVTGMGGQVTAELGDDGETVVYASLPDVEAAQAVARAASEVWANAERQEHQVVFVVETRLAVDLRLVRLKDVVDRSVSVELTKAVS